MTLCGRVSVLFFLITIVFADPYFTSILYQEIPHKFCNRYYYRNGGIGCHTAIDGVNGVLLRYSPNSTILSMNTTKTREFAVLVSSEEYPNVILDLLQKDNVASILIYGTNQSSIPYSPMSKTPGGKDTPSEGIALHKDIEWNPFGLNYYFTDNNKPIVHISDENTIDILLEKANRNEQVDYIHPFIADVDLYMGPNEMNSLLCLEKGACQPIGGQTVWSREGKQGKPIVVIATALDSLSDFYETTNPVDAGITLSIMLTLVKALATVQNEIKDVEILVSFFQGESWGRVGSRRFLHDIESFNCKKVVNITHSPFNDKMCTSPLKLSLEFQNIDKNLISQVIVFDQLMSSSGELFSHSESVVEHKVIQEGISYIPPGIGESFMQAGISNVDVITGFNSTYNSYYGSSMNTITENEFPAIFHIANQLLEEFIWKFDLDSSIQLDENYLKQLVLCFAVNGTCTLLEQELGLEKDVLTKNLHGKPYPTAAGTFSDGRQPYLITPKGLKSVDYDTEPTIDLKIYFNPSLLENFVHTELTLNYHTNTSIITCSTWKDCKSLPNGYCIKGQCYASKAYFHDAYDLGIISKAPNVFIPNSEVQNTPIYTEPYWGGYYGSDPAIKVYQETSIIVEIVMFVTGIIVTVLAWWFTKYCFSNYGSQLKLDK